MVPREPPYPPPPRHAPFELGRRGETPPVVRAVGIVGHLVGVALYAMAPFAAAAGALAFLTAEQTNLIVRIAGFAVCTVLAFVYLKTLLPRRLPLPPAVIPVPPDHQPTAYAFVRRVADDLGVSASHRLFIGSGTELRLSGRRSLLDLFRAPRWELHIGLWLWHMVTLSEFQALVARTIAPTSGGRMERFRSTVRTLLETMTDGVDRVDEAAAQSDATLAGLARLVRGTHRGLLVPIRLVARLLLRIDPVRDDTRSDDLAAVRIAGSDALVHAILRADFAAAALREADSAIGLAAAAGLWTNDLYEHVADGSRAVRETHNDFTLGEPPLLRGPAAGKHAEVFEPGQGYLSKIWAGFPPPDQREQDAKRDFVAAERDDRPAAELLDDPARLRERLTALRYLEVLQTDDDYLSLPPATVRRWRAIGADSPFPAKYAGCYDAGRPLEPGTTLERQDALGGEPWDDTRLVSMAANLYGRAAERATAWRNARAILDRMMLKTVYHPIGRQRARAEDLEDDVRKSGRWLAALDRWAFVIHVHMAGRLPDPKVRQLLLERYDSVLRFQPIAADSGKYRKRVAAFVEKLEEYSGHTPYQLGRDAAREFAASRKDLGALLSEAAVLKDPLLAEWTAEVPLDEFLFSHDERPPPRARGTLGYGRRLLRAWAEIEEKARWLHRLGVGMLLELHERIEREFTAQVPASVVEAVAAAGSSFPVVPPPLPKIASTGPIELEVDQPDFVDEPPTG